MPHRCGRGRLNKKTSRETKSTALTLARLERLSRLMRGASQTEGLNAAQWEALRYLNRANSFSNSPGAMARYLGATKGTTSQTVLALIKKGAIAKLARGDDGRSVVLTVTEAGLKLLASDPLLHIEKAIAQLGDKTSKRFAKGLREILGSEITRQNEPAFGTCFDCRHLIKNGGANFCTLMNMAVGDIEKLCVFHELKS